MNGERQQMRLAHGQSPLDTAASDLRAADLFYADMLGLGRRRGSAPARSRNAAETIGEEIVPSAPPNAGERVVHLPLLKAHAARGFRYDLSGPNCVVRWEQIPQGFAGAVDVVVHFHGYKAHNAMRLQAKADASGLDLDLPGVRRPTVGLVPHGRAFPSAVLPGTDGFSFPALTTRPSLMHFIDAALGALKAAIGSVGRDLSLGRLLLTGHSGGGAALNRLMAAGDAPNIHGFHYFDATYPGSETIAAPGGWLAAALRRDISALEKVAVSERARTLVERGSSLRIVFLEKTPTAPAAHRVHAFIEQRLDELTRDPALRALVARYYRAQSIDPGSRIDHGAVPRAVGGLLLADAGHDLGGLTRELAPHARKSRGARAGRAHIESVESRDVFESVESGDVFESVESRDVFESVESRDVFESVESGDVFETDEDVESRDVCECRHENHEALESDEDVESQDVFEGGEEATPVFESSGGVETTSFEGDEDVEAYGTDWDARFRQALEGFLAEFSSIPVGNGLRVHPPYFMNVNDPAAANPVTLARYRLALEHRQRTSHQLRALIGETRFHCTRMGKGTPAEIAAFLQSSIEQRLLVPGSSGTLTAEDCRAFLIRYGMGIDCSGFVSQALNRLVALFTEAVAGDRVADVCNTASSALKGDSATFLRVRDCRDLCAGDSMWLSGHIRIISLVQASGTGVVFHTIESRAGEGTVERPGSEGPARAVWRLEADRSAESGNFSGFRLERARDPSAAAPTWLRVSTAHTYSRYRPLAALLLRRGVRSIPLEIGGVAPTEAAPDSGSVTQRDIDRLVTVTFGKAADIEKFFSRRGAPSFFDWFNDQVAGRPGFLRGTSPLRIGTSATVRQHFSAFWDRIPIAYDRPRITVLDFSALLCIVLNETEGDFHGNPERCGGGRSDARGPHRGLAYAFDRIQDIKRSYNTLAGNRRAGDLFNDAEYVQAHGSLGGATRLANKGAEFGGAWNSESYPQGEFTTDENSATNGFIMHADFYKFRGRGVIQTTGREAYLRVVSFIQGYQGQNGVLVEFRNRWKTLTPQTVATVSTNEDWDRIFAEAETLARGLALHSGQGGNDYRFMDTRVEILTHVPPPPASGNARGTAGSIYAMGSRITGRYRYGAGVYLQRVCELLNRAVALL